MGKVRETDFNNEVVERGMKVKGEKAFAKKWSEEFGEKEKVDG